MNQEPENREGFDARLATPAMVPGYWRVPRVDRGVAAGVGFCRVPVRWPVADLSILVGVAAMTDNAFVATATDPRSSLLESRRS